MSRVIHRYEGFETCGEALRFIERQGYGHMLDYTHNRSDMAEYVAIKGDGLNTTRYPYIVVWNETEGEQA